MALIVRILGIQFGRPLSQGRTHGFAVALGRLSPNWLLSRIAGGYVELIRNLPLLFQLLFWYKAVLAALPGPRQSYTLFDWFFLSNRGLVIPKAIAAPGLEPFLIAAAIAIAAAFVLRRYARKELFEKGHKITVWPYVLGLIVGLPLLATLIFGRPFTLEMPSLRGFNFAGGSRVIPEFVALALALSTYTAAFIAEIVRAGIQAVPRGQSEAARALGLTEGQRLRLVVLPQALRVIIPPLTSQYLNLMKNSSLAIAVGYPDLVAVTNTILNQSGRVVQVVALVMLSYLSVSLAISALLNWYNRRVALVER